MAAEAAFKDVPEIFEVITREYLLMAMLSSAFPHRSSWESRSSRGRRPLVRFTCVLGHVHLIEILSATFRELGPPDLCHVIKSTARAGQREVSAASNSKNTRNTRTDRPYTFALPRSLCRRARTTTSPASTRRRPRRSRRTSTLLHIPSRNHRRGSRRVQLGK